MIYSFLLLTALKRKESAKEVFPSIGSSSLYLFPILLPLYNPQVKMSSLLRIWRLWLVSLPPTSLSGCPSLMSCSSLLIHEVSHLWFSLNLVRLVWIRPTTVIYLASQSLPSKWKQYVQRLNYLLRPLCNRRIWAKNVKYSPNVRFP